MSRAAVNGVYYNVERFSEAGPPLLLLHGFTGSAATWSSFASVTLDPDLAAARHRARTPSKASPLPREGEGQGEGAAPPVSATSRWRDYSIVAIDFLGHGDSDSPADPERYTTARWVDDLAAIMDTLGIGNAAVLGYSMGGRAALRFALARPERVRALVLESAAPGIEDGAERSARVASDEALADDIERDGIEPFVDRWQAIPLFASQASLPEATRTRLREQRLRNVPRGLANSLRGMGAGRDAPVFDRLGELRMPALIIAGGLDAKYRALAQRMAAGIAAGADAALAIVPEAGHAVHLERPDVFRQTVVDFLSGLTPEGVRGEERQAWR